MIIIPEVSIFSNPLRDSARRIVPLLAIFFYFYAKNKPRYRHCDRGYFPELISLLDKAFKLVLKLGYASAAIH